MFAIALATMQIFAMLNTLDYDKTEVKGCHRATYTVNAIHRQPALAGYHYCTNHIGFTYMNAIHPPTSSGLRPLAHWVRNSYPKCSHVQEKKRQTSKRQKKVRIGFDFLRFFRILIQHFNRFFSRSTEHCMTRKVWIIKTKGVGRFI